MNESSASAIEAEILCQEVHDACVASGFDTYEIVVFPPEAAEPPSPDTTESGHGQDDLPEEPPIVVRIVSRKFAGQSLERRQQEVWHRLEAHLSAARLVRLRLWLETPAEASGLVVGPERRYPKPFVVIQGGGAKGCWQGAVLYELLSGGTRPVGAIGSSAGAINCWLMSAKLGECTDNPFDDFWMVVPFVVILMVPLVLLLLAVWSARLLVQRAFSRGPARRNTAIFPFMLYAYVFRLLLPETPADVNTYMYAANVDSPHVPPVFDSQKPFTFWFKPGQTLGETTARADAGVPYWAAIAASACLPFIEPMKLGDQHFADGGFYSNLPANLVRDHGPLGGDCVVCVLATPLRELDPAKNCIDYRTAVLLDQLLQAQATVRHHPGSATTASALHSCPIFVIQPHRRLKSGLVRGFVDLCALSEDVAWGRATGRAFAKAVARFVAGDERALLRYELNRGNAPPLPSVPPAHRQKWMPWINRAWVGQHAGIAEQVYPVVGRVQARRRG